MILVLHLIKLIGRMVNMLTIEPLIRIYLPVKGGPGVGHIQ